MLDAGGGYGGTNWSAASVIDMWLAIANQETTPHWQLLSGWRKSYELTLQHMAQVKNYRENLAAAWPPEKSPAAAAYLARLDELILHLQGTYDAAVANYTAFSNATLALSSARTDLEKVVNEYLANEGKLQTFAREQAERPKGGLQRGPEPKPPVPNGRQAELEAKARSIMYGLSTEISHARVQITKPSLYNPAGHADGGETTHDGPAYTPPPVPAIVPFTPSTPSSGGAATGSAQNASGIQPAATSPPAPRQPGLILGGVGTPVPAPPTPNPQPPVVGGPSVPTAGGPVPVPTPPIAPGIPSPPGIGRALPGMAVPANPTGGNGGVRAMPPGGVIGGIPGSGLGQPAASSRPMAAVNPVGGLINQPNANNGRSPTGRSVSQSTPVIGIPPSRTGDAGDEAVQHLKWDPDNPWATAEGVTPVLMPPPEQRIDPGPAIGLR